MESGEQEKIAEVRAENIRNAFWERDDILGARNALDVWASCRWSRYEQADLPTMETIFEHPEAEFTKFWDSVHKTWLDGIGIGRLPHIRPVDSKEALIEFSLDRILEDCGDLAVSILHRLYPRCGPYCQQQYLRDMKDPEGAILRAFRPEKLVGRLRDGYLSRDLVTLYNRLHRESLVAVASACALPAEVFACQIERVTVPAKPLRAKERRGVMRVVVAGAEMDIEVVE